MLILALIYAILDGHEQLMLKMFFVESHGIKMDVCCPCVRAILFVWYKRQMI